MIWHRTGEHVAHRSAGIIEGVVFGSPDNNPKEYTWQLHVATGYFAAGSAPTLEAAVQQAEVILAKTIAQISGEFFNDYIGSEPDQPTEQQVKE